MADILFVAGSFHGGWYFDHVAAALRGRGHRVITPTLTGLGEGHHHDGSIDLDTHIDDVIAVAEREALRDAVLIGHSYGGMVITGVAARRALSLRHLIYLDAMLPVSGESLWDVIPEALRSAILAASPDGLSTIPPDDLTSIDSRVVPHPIASYRQPVVYSDADFPERKTYVWAAGNPGSPFETMRDRLALQPDWEIVTVPYGHDVMREASGPMAELIERLVAEPAERQESR